MVAAGARAGRVPSVDGMRLHGQATSRVRAVAVFMALSPSSWPPADTPAVESLCRWQVGAASALRGSAVLEVPAGASNASPRAPHRRGAPFASPPIQLGTVTGAVGMHAASLGAARVVLAVNDPIVEHLVSSRIEEHRGRFGAAEVVLSRSRADSPAPPDFVLAADVATATGDPDTLCATLASLLASTPPPRRVVLAHEHCLRRAAGHWERDDADLLLLLRAADAAGLAVSSIEGEGVPIGVVTKARANVRRRPVVSLLEVRSKPKALDEEGRPSASRA